MEEKVGHDQLVSLARRAAMDVFQTMLGMELEPGEPYQESDPPAATGGVLSLIGFTGDWIGTGSFCCTVSMARRIADALFMTEHHAVEEEVLDAVGEMTNMILGNVKTDLEELLGPLQLGIPTVIYGHNFTRRSMLKRQWTVVPFLFSGERVEVQICMGPNTSPSRACDGHLRPCVVQV